LDSKKFSGPEPSASQRARHWREKQSKKSLAVCPSHWAEGVCSSVTSPSCPEGRRPSHAWDPGGVDPIGVETRGPSSRREWGEVRVEFNVNVPF